MSRELDFEAAQTPGDFETISPWARRSQEHEACEHPAICLETEYDRGQ
jgi:hypothetical protein